jgi:hypothetical protein
VNERSRKLLICGAIAGPLYVLVGLIQILVRPGFDVRKHALSLMSNGELGWIQVANFLVTGLLLVAFAVGLRKTLAGTKAGTFGPLLIAIYGFGMIGAGVFSADPALGFPPGTPEDARGISTSGLLHFVFGGMGFYALIAACFVFAKRFWLEGDRTWFAFSIATGAFFFAAFAGIASGSASARTFVTLAFYVAILIVWCWLTLLALKFTRENLD